MISNFWAPRRCFVEPIREMFDAAQLLSEAADAHLAGDPVKVDRLIRAADIKSIGDWTDTIWGRENPEIHGFREVPNAPSFVSTKGRPGRMPNAEARRRIAKRDGHRCRFCGLPVISSEIRIQLHRLYPAAVRWGGKNRDQHFAFQCMWLQYDHVLPFERGGTSSDDNVVIACAPCNYGRNCRTLEEVGLLDPRLLPVEPSSWDGLERLALRRTNAASM